ncbi:MAG: hypothetical protein OXN80_06390, partial [bacterium]|nr:hypothetical protein [bacterium]
APDWILVSCGFDAHHLDPLAGLRLTEGDYHFMAEQLLEVVASNRILVFLEGGYDLDAIAGSTQAMLLGVAGRPYESSTPTQMSPASGHRALERLVDIHDRVSG